MHCLQTLDIQKSSTSRCGWAGGGSPGCQSREAGGATGTTGCMWQAMPADPGPLKNPAPAGGVGEGMRLGEVQAKRCRGDRWWWPTRVPTLAMPGL